MAHQTCLAHLARDVAFVDETSEDMLPLRLRLWLTRLARHPQIDQHLACVQSSACRAYTFVRAKKQCWLKRQPGTPQAPEAC